MATAAEIATLRAMVGDTTLTDVQLGQIFDSAECMNQAAGMAWGRKAAGYAELVNISEAGSSRSMGDLHKNALTMSKYYFDLGCPVKTLPPRNLHKTQTRAIARL